MSLQISYFQISGEYQVLMCGVASLEIVFIELVAYFSRNVWQRCPRASVCLFFSMEISGSRFDDLMQSLR